MRLLISNPLGLSGDRPFKTNLICGRSWDGGAIFLKIDEYPSRKFAIKGGRGAVFVVLCQLGCGNAPIDHLDH